jgi:hypothetical protein
VARRAELGAPLSRGVFLVAALLVATDRSYAAAFGGRRIRCARAAPARHLSARLPQPSGLLRPVAGAARVSGLHVRAAPRELGIALVAATVCYLVDVLAAFRVPDLGRQIHSAVLIVPAIAETSMVGYLLVEFEKVVVLWRVFTPRRQGSCAA